VPVWHDACDDARSGEGVEYFELIRTLVGSGTFRTPEQAECALFTTLEMLGSLLPEVLLRELALELPAECGQALGLGASIGLGRAQRSELAGHEIERVQATFSRLAVYLTPQLVHQVERELPAFLLRSRTLLPRASMPEREQPEISRALLAGGGLRRSGRS
jgi:hypothetical protein